LEPEGPSPTVPPTGLLHHVVKPLLARLADLQRRPGQRRPLLLLNGPVGAGKSTLVRQLAHLAPAHGLRLAVASIDDAYRPLPERLSRLEGNPFGVTRVPPGSHDVELLVDRIESWRGGSSLRLPRFDKTLAAGQGDRCGDSVEAADALVLEGWLMGCRPLGEAAVATGLAGLQHWDLSEDERRWVPHWDRELQNYESLWRIADGLWVLRPRHWRLARRWRFQAEARQRRAGGGWLATDELDRLVRSSLHSLPPPLYQDPLVAGFGGGEELGGASTEDPEGSAAQQAGGLAANLPVVGVSQLDGRRRWEPLDHPAQLSPSSSSSAIG
jgi:D-glycerate 3-kinase